MDSTTKKQQSTESGLTAEQRKVRKLSRVLDEAVGLPGGQRVGLDAVIGLIPGVGDIVSLGIAGYIFTTAYRSGASKATLLRMSMNSALDTVVGSVPLVGDLFDLVWRSNSRNAALLDNTLQNSDLSARSDKSALVLIGGSLLVAFGLIVYASFKTAAWIWAQI